MKSKIKTLKEKADLYLEQENPGPVPRQVGIPNPDPAAGAPGLDPKHYHSQQKQYKTFGQKAKEMFSPSRASGRTGTTLAQQMGSEFASPFHLGALKFQNGKLYYLNIISGAGFRNLDPEEQLQRFIEYGERLKQTGQPDKQKTVTPETEQPAQQATEQPAQQQAQQQSTVDYTQTRPEVQPIQWAESLTKIYEYALEDEKKDFDVVAEEILAEAPLKGQGFSSPTPIQGQLDFGQSKRRRDPKTGRFTSKAKHQARPVDPIGGEQEQGELGLQTPESENKKQYSLDVTDETIRSVVMAFKKAGFNVNPEQSSRLLKDNENSNILWFFAQFAKAFPEFKLEVASYDARTSAPIKGKESIEGKRKKHVKVIFRTLYTYLGTNLQLPSQSEEVDENELWNKDSIKQRVDTFIGLTKFQLLNSETWEQTYGKLNNLLKNLSKIFVDRYNYEFLSPSFDLIKAKSPFACHPFDENGNVKDLECFVNVITNHVAEAARNNVGFYPYMVLGEFIDANGLKERPSLSVDDDSIRRKRSVEDSNVQAFSSESVVTEARPTGTPVGTKSRTQGSSGYQRVGRYQQGGEIFQTPGRMPSAIGKGQEGEKFLHVTPTQLETFHGEMVKYFVKPGWLLYLTPDQWSKTMNRGGLFTRAIKKVGSEIYQAGANVPRPQL